MKNPIQSYMEYVRDNPSEYWFKRKIYGWGWTPVTWQGWLSTVVFALLMILIFLRIDKVSSSANDTLYGVFPIAILLVVLFIILCNKKGEKLKWQWGIDKDEQVNGDGQDNLE